MNEWTYGFREFASVDPVRGLIYTVDAEDPLAVKAFSIVDGSVVATLGGGEGEGPGELKNMVAIDATAQGVLAAGHARVNHWGADGALVAEWRPLVPVVRGVCAMGNRMAVPLPGDGVLLRHENGDESILGQGRTGGSLVVDDLSSANEAILRFARRKIRCLADHAYVLSGYDHQLVGYSMTGARHEVVLPDELVEAGQRRIERSPNSIPYTLLRDDQDRLVITMWWSTLAAAVVDPHTGCYSIVTDPRPTAGRRYVGMYRDSVLVMESPPETRVVGGRPRQVTYAGESSVIVLRPLVATGGEPCRPGASR